MQRRPPRHQRLVVRAVLLCGVLGLFLLAGLKLDRRVLLWLVSSEGGSDRCFGGEITHIQHLLNFKHFLAKIAPLMPALGRFRGGCLTGGGGTGEICASEETDS